MVNASGFAPKTLMITLFQLVFVALFACYSTSALADDQTKLPVQYSLSPNGVNLQSGSFVYNKTDLVIGDLSLIRTWNSDALHRPGLRLFGAITIREVSSLGWTHSLYQGTRVQTLATADVIVTVYVEGETYTHNVLQNDTYSPRGHLGAGSYLRREGGNFHLTRRDGSEDYFVVLPSINQENNPGNRNQALQQTVKPDGTTIAYTYDASGRLQEARSSRGFAIHFDYDGSGNISQACGVNLAQTYWTSASSCAGASLKATYSYDSSGSYLTSIANVTGGVSQISYGSQANQGPTCLSLINSTICEIENTYGTSASSTNQACGTRDREISSQKDAAGNIWTYCYDPMPNSADEPYYPGWPRRSYATMVEPDGFTHNLSYDRGRLVDDSGRQGLINYKYPAEVYKSPTATSTITFDYMDTRPEMITYPEGNVDYYVYNYQGSVELLMRVPKNGQDAVLTDGSLALPTDLDLRQSTIRPGSLQVVPGSISFKQAFDNGCGNGYTKVCDKPSSRTDANGNRTDLTYDPAHGGVLTETGPAVNGIQPQTRYTYVQRVAWIKNGSGGYVQAGAVIWLLASKSACRTSAASGSGCSTAGDELVTTYQYGPDNGPNNLFLRGIAETANGVTLRTCYTYDWAGNRISDTKPRGVTVTSCP